MQALGDSEARRMAFVAPHASAGRLTEIGPGSGVFTVQAVDAGFDVTVIEMDEEGCEHLATTLGVRSVCTSRPEEALLELPESRVIAMWHVLEHLGDPWAVIDAAAANLEPGGILVIAVPNPESFGAHVLGGRWPHVDAPRHLFLIPAHTLIGRARKGGLEVVELTADDAVARSLNAMAWHFAIRPPGRGGFADRLAVTAGVAMGTMLAPIERRGLRGAAYTVVLRKPA